MYAIHVTIQSVATRVICGLGQLTTTSRICVRRGDKHEECGRVCIPTQRAAQLESDTGVLN